MENLQRQNEVDRDLDMFEAEREWRASLPKHSLVGWLQIFPTAKKDFGASTKLKLKVRKEILKLERKQIVDEVNRMLDTNPLSNRWADPIFKDYGNRLTHDIDKKIRAIEHQLELLPTIGREHVLGVQKMVQITDAMIAKAREYPLSLLIDINRAGFAHCIWHNEKNPSMFCKKNFAHCFSCNKTGDTIAVLMQTSGLKFKEAVIKLQ